MGPGTETISVVMPVRNALPYLDDAISSILSQTHSQFELVIRDDGSTDGSRAVLRQWAKRDRRIRLFEANHSAGPAGSADWVVRQSSHPIVARMDADDISHPDRLRRQLELLSRQPDVVLTGCLFEGIDDRNRVVRVRDRSPLASRNLSAPFPHGSIMFRREIFDRVGGYRSACDFWEDLDLYWRFAACGRIVVLPEPLYLFRHSSASTRLTSHQERVEAAVDLMFDCIDAAERGGDYEALLAAPRQGGKKVNPRTFVSFGSIRLWAGKSPRLLMRTLKRARLTADPASMKILVWLLWATVSPRSLRWCLNLLLRYRDQRADKQFPEQDVYDWGYQRQRAGTFRHVAAPANYCPLTSQAAAQPSMSSS